MIKTLVVTASCLFTLVTVSSAAQAQQEALLQTPAISSPAQGRSLPPQPGQQVRQLLRSRWHDLHPVLLRRRGKLRALHQRPDDAAHGRRQRVLPEPRRPRRLERCLPFRRYTAASRRR